MTTHKKNVLIIGRSGQLANELQTTVGPDYDLVMAGRNDINLLDTAFLHDYVKSNNFDVVINTSAYTAVDKAESEVDQAYAVNQTAVQNLALACKTIGALLIHVSTDFVFGGKKPSNDINENNTPWQTDDPVAPQGVYAKSKLAGELAIQEHYADNSVIIRTSWLYSTYGNNFVKTMLKLMDSRPELAVVSDQIGSPTYAKGLAEFIWQLIDAPSRLKLYHWSDSGVTSWHGFAKEIARQGVELGLLKSEPIIQTTSTEAFGAPAPRPAYSVMDCAMAYQVKPGKVWQQQLKSMLETLKSNQ